MADILTIVEGEGRSKYESGGPDHLFDHLEPLYEFLPMAKPDNYDGALPRQINWDVRQDLGQFIVPCNNTNRPAAPSFFIEGKSAQGHIDVATRQAYHHGAIGARARQSLQDYRRTEPQYDGDMKNYSTGYHPSSHVLKLYGHHMTPPRASGGRQEYYMTQIGGYCMSNDRETFQQGATAFRNLRDFAKQYRDELFEKANHAAGDVPT